MEQIVAEQQDFPPEGAERGPSDMSGITLHMLGHAHIDLGYRWDFEEAIHRIAPDTFRGVLELMQKTPGFTFCQSQMFLYAQMEKEYPAIFARIRQFIAEGRWEVVGGAWCEYDAILPSGEAVISGWEIVSSITVVSIFSLSGVGISSCEEISIRSNSTSSR